RHRQAPELRSGRVLREVHRRGHRQLDERVDCGAGGHADAHGDPQRERRVHHDHRGSSEVSRTYRILLTAVVAVLALGGYWKLALAPKRAEAAALAGQVATQKAQLAQTQSLIKTYQGAQSAYKTNYSSVVRLGKAVPSDDDTRSLVVQLDAAAKRSGVD